MKRLNVYLALFVVLLSILACNLPWENPPQEPTATPTETEAPPVVITPSATPYACAPGLTAMAAFSVEFCYPPSLTTGIAQAMIPENPPSVDAAPWDYNPNTIELSLQGYPINNQYHQPVINIYPVADYIALEPNIQTTITSLQALLTSQDPNPKGISFLPIYNAAQMMQAQVSYLDFRNGSGVRFITQYGQAALPINNISAIYAFSGLTDDGQYWISATFPVTHPSFEDDNMTEPAEGWEAFTNNYETYVTDMETFLAAEPSGAFTPDLQLLDEMMASFLVPTNAIP